MYVYVICEKVHIHMLTIAFNNNIFSFDTFKQHQWKTHFADMGVTNITFQSSAA